MQASYMCKNLMERLDNGEPLEGHISSVFKSLFTVITDEDELIYFLNNKKYIAPNSVVLEDIDTFKDLNLTQDTKVIFNKDKIVIDSHKIEIELDNCQPWDPTPCLLDRESSNTIITENLLTVEECIFKHGKYEGIAPLVFNIGNYIEELRPLSDLDIHNNLYSSFISNKIIDFIYEIMDNDITHISISVEEFIGFGPGVTPSSDDFLCGFMNALVYFGIYYNLDIDKIYEFNKNMISRIDIDSQDISHDLLLHSTKGEAQKMIVNLIQSILYESDAEEVCQSVREAISFGDMSGTDMVCGVYLGTRVLGNEKVKKLFT